MKVEKNEPCKQRLGQMMTTIMTSCESCRFVCKNVIWL